MTTKKINKSVDKSRKPGRPPKGSISKTNLIRSVILENPQLKISAIRDIAETLPEMDGMSKSLVNQTFKTLPSFFLIEANRIGIPINRLIEFLNICKKYPCETVAENIEARGYNKKESAPTSLSDIRKSVLSKLAKLS